VKRVGLWLLVVGWAGAVLVPIVGIITGIYVRAASSKDPEGVRIPKYDRWSRGQAAGMIVVALLIIVLGIVIQYRRR
jgi:O-antigen ligase